MEHLPQQDLCSATGSLHVEWEFQECVVGHAGVGTLGFHFVMVPARMLQTEKLLMRSQWAEIGRSHAIGLMPTLQAADAPSHGWPENVHK